MGQSKIPLRGGQSSQALPEESLQEFEVNLIRLGIVADKVKEFSIIKISGAKRHHNPGPELALRII